MGSGMRRAGPMARAARRQAAGPVHFRFAKARQAQAMEDSRQKTPMVMAADSSGSMRSMTPNRLTDWATV